MNLLFNQFAPIAKLGHLATNLLTFDDESFKTNMRNRQIRECGLIDCPLQFGWI